MVQHQFIERVLSETLSKVSKRKEYLKAYTKAPDPTAIRKEKLKAKGVRFSTKEVIIAESKVEALIDCIEERAEIIIVPDGTAVVLDDITLDEDTLRRYGKQLYVIGDVTVPEDADALDEIQYLHVRGDAKVPQKHKEKLLEVLTEISGEVRIAKPKGATLEDKPFLKITRWMLEQQPLGIDVSDCAVVKIADDIPKELIVQRLHIEDCGVVQCSQELGDAVTMICTDVGHVGGAEGDDSMGIGDMLKNAMGGIKGMLDTKMINAADYVL